MCDPNVISLHINCFLYYFGSLDNAIFIYTFKPSGLLLAPAAMTSRCFGEKWYSWEEASGMDSCMNTLHNAAGNCTVRAEYGQCVLSTVRDVCGEAFAGLGRMFIDAHLATFNSGEGAMQC